MEAIYPTIKPSLNLDFANTRRLDPRIAFTRVSSGTYFDEFGRLVTAAANVPRFDHDPVTGESLGLLIEAQATNLCISSNDLRTSAEGNPVNSWVDVSGFVVLTPNATIGPDGLMSLDAIVENTTGVSQFLRYINFAGTINTQYCAYAVVKKGDRRYYRLSLTGPGFNSANYTCIIDFDTGTVQSVNSPDAVGIKNLGNGLYLIWVTATSDGGGGNYNVTLGVTSSPNSIGAVFGEIGYKTYVGFVNVIQGSHPSSFIITNGSEVTRAADSAVMTDTNFSDWYNATEGTLFAEADTNDVTTSRVSAYISDGTTANRIHTNANQSPAAFIGNNHVAQMSQNIPSVIRENGVFSKTVLAYAPDNGNAAVNGTLGTLDTSLTVPVVNQMRLGGISTINSPLNGHIKRIAYYPRRLSDTQLQTLTG